MTRRRLKNTIVDMSTSEKLSERGSCIETKRVLILSNNSNSTQSPGCYLGAILFTAYISLFRLFSPQFKAIYCTKTDGLQSMKVSPFPLLTVCMDLNVEISQWTNQSLLFSSQGSNPDMMSDTVYPPASTALQCLLGSKTLSSMVAHSMYTNNSASLAATTVHG